MKWRYRKENFWKFLMLPTTVLHRYIRTWWKFVCTQSEDWLAWCYSCNCLFLSYSSQIQDILTNWEYALTLIRNCRCLLYNSPNFQISFMCKSDLKLLLFRQGKKDLSLFEGCLFLTSHACSWFQLRTMYLMKRKIWISCNLLLDLFRYPRL